MQKLVMQKPVMKKPAGLQLAEQQGSDHEEFDYDFALSQSSSIVEMLDEVGHVLQYCYA